MRVIKLFIGLMLFCSVCNFGFVKAELEQTQPVSGIPAVDSAASAEIILECYDKIVLTILNLDKQGKDKFNYNKIQSELSEGSQLSFRFLKDNFWIFIRSIKWLLIEAISIVVAVFLSFATASAFTFGTAERRKIYCGISFIVIYVVMNFFMAIFESANNNNDQIADAFIKLRELVQKLLSGFDVLNSKEKKVVLELLDKDYLLILNKIQEMERDNYKFLSKNDKKILYGLINLSKPWKTISGILVGYAGYYSCNYYIPAGDGAFDGIKNKSIAVGAGVCSGLVWTGLLDVFLYVFRMTFSRYNKNGAINILHQINMMIQATRLKEIRVKKG